MLTGWYICLALGSLSRGISEMSQTGHRHSHFGLSFPRALLSKAPEHFFPIRGALLRGAFAAQAGIHVPPLPIYQLTPKDVPPSSIEQRITKSSNSGGSCVLYPCRHDGIHEVPFLVILNKIQHLECFYGFLHARGRHVIPL